MIDGFSDCKFPQEDFRCMRIGTLVPSMTKWFGPLTPDQARALSTPDCETQLLCMTAPLRAWISTWCDPANPTRHFWCIQQVCPRRDTTFVRTFWSCLDIVRRRREGHRLPVVRQLSPPPCASPSCDKQLLRWLLPCVSQIRAARLALFSTTCSMAGMVPLPITAIDLVKAADAAVKAADDEPSRGVDALNYLAKQEVTASILLATGAGKKVFVSPRCIHGCCSLQRRVFPADSAQLYSRSGIMQQSQIYSNAARVILQQGTKLGADPGDHCTSGSAELR